MENICCIILNYNDAETTKKLVGELRESKVISHILVVDNCSLDGSWEALEELAESDLWASDSHGPALHLMRTGENGGYGRGNQAGIDYAMEYMNPAYILIANPDIHVTDGCLLRLKEALEQQERAALASAMVVSPAGQPLFSYWDLQPLWKDLLDTGPVTRRLLKHFLKTPLKKLPAAGDKAIRQVGAVPGSLFMLDMGCLGGGQAAELFDRNIFLYYEEKVLGQKLRSLGLKELLVTDAFYIHAHSVSINKSVGKIADKQRILHESKLYYYREYLHAGPWKMAAAKAFLAVVMAEVRFLTGVLHMRW